ncbi:homeobox protein Meis1-like [Anopheles aquasalis]|uniref:homeobox protein Meis1-like n=1 Tax=Anopheles aquasalis TaxID=42839 RepID=UPI00215B01FA|nr:homeobox protein Meis1-like [Anopheles aquasalis]XP_050096869.1 homeobox protein Meis1-like [Anopheles aquasalis]XP_050096870.1 homeobox protein Meis1-like [Anopheles aquasalis]XP_050096871.1 homeobox protein Meis1-like [Anopheles aquasalis]
MQESSVTALPVSGVTATGLGIVGGNGTGNGGAAINATINLTTSTASGNGSVPGLPGGPVTVPGMTGSNAAAISTTPGGGTSSSSSGSGNTNNNTIIPSSNNSSSNSSSSSSTISPHGLSDMDQAQFEADKRAVYKHPLFSLLALLLEKCEQATQGYIPSQSSASSPNGSSNNGAGDGDSFSRDIQAFVQLLEKEKRPLLTNNSELDGLMIKALQVLRIHLLELEKVQELCRDFCTRYIACLRSKMQSENLLRSDYALEHNNNLSNSNSPINSPEQDLSGSAQGYYQGGDYLQGSDTSDYSNMQAKGAEYSDGSDQQQQFQQLQNTPAVALLQHPLHQQGPAVVAPVMATVPDAMITSRGDTDMNNPLTSVLEGSTQLTDLTAAAAATAMAFQQHHSLQQQQHPAYQHHQLAALRYPPPAVALPTLPLDMYAGQLSPCGSSDELDSELDDDSSSGGKRLKRGILPKQATGVMRAWLFQHLVHPYPTEDEKRAIAAQTSLTLLQVNNWFINARRRILLPMLENASDNSGE